MSGVFITLEGGEGCGKSTQLKLLKEYFEKKGEDVVYAREPGGCETSEKLRELVLSSKNEGKICDRTEALIYAAARAELYHEIIKPALDKDKIVVVDRYYDSSVAYQGFARGLGEEEVMNLTKFAISGKKTDLTILFLISPEDGFKRKGGVDENDRLETQGMKFHQKVFEGYKYIANKEPERVAVIDATKTIEEVFADVIHIIENKVPRLKNI